MITEFQKEYRWLSNFEPCTILLDGVEYQSVEHAYMSCKSSDPKWKSFCADKNVTAGKVKRASKDIELIPDWENKKIDVMRMCLTQKYTQEPFKSKLLATGNALIQEGNHWGDKFWGVCLKTGEGENILGKLIMDIRDVTLKVTKIMKQKSINYDRYKYLIFASPISEYVCNNGLFIDEKNSKEEFLYVTNSYLNAKIFDSFEEAKDYVDGIKASRYKHNNNYSIFAIAIEDLLKLRAAQSTG